MKISRRIIRTLFLVVLWVSTATGQFLDATVSIKLSGVQFREKTGNMLTLSGLTETYGSRPELEGVALRLAAESQSVVEFQFRDHKGNWSEPVIATLFAEPFSERLIASFRGDAVKGSTAFRYGISVQKGEVAVLSAGLMVADREAIPETEFPPLQKMADVDKPKIISRDEWGARSPKSDYSNHPYFDKLTLHHAAGWAARSLDEGKQQVKSIQEFHQDGRGWSDIGYHFVVDMVGNIYQGRPETVLGAHVGGANTGNIGVCILGCYHPPEQNWPCYDEMTEDTENALVHLYAWLSETYDVDPSVLKGHRDYFGNTSCPGDNVWPLLPQLRTDIALYIEFGLQPTHFALYQNYPNPFNPKTTLHYDLPENLHVSLKIFDITGRHIRTLMETDQHAGYKKVDWDGKDDTGKPVSAGVYLYSVEMGGFSSTKKMVLLK